MTTALTVPEAQRTDVVSETTGAAAAAREKAAVEARFVMAMHRPRQWDDVRNRLLDACRRPMFAASAMYSKPVGGKSVVGMSIRFVEEALRCARNVDIVAPVVAEDASVRVVRVGVTDLEANVTFSADITIEKTVERRQAKDREILGQRLNTKGETVYIVAATEEELLVKTNNQKSKEIRNCGLRILPGDIVEEARALIVKTVQDEDAKDPRAATKRLTDAAWTFGISAAEIESYIGAPLDQLSSAQRQLMREVLQAIKDGETTWADVVGQKAEGPKPPTKGMGSLRAKLVEEPAATVTSPAPVTTDAPQESATSEPAPAPLSGASSAAEIQLENLRAEVQALLDDEGTPERSRVAWTTGVRTAADVDDLYRIRKAIRAARENKKPAVA